MKDLLGTVIDQDYRLDALLTDETGMSSGSRTSVFRATQLSTGMTVAVKMLSPEVGSGSKFRERFDREMAIASKLVHQNIVHVLSVGYHENGSPYLVMDYVPMSLGRLLEEKKRLPEERVLGLVNQICIGLQYAYRQGVKYHRDLKPDNILLTPEGCVKIADFGIAGLAGVKPITREGVILGTYFYMSPEQCRGKIDELSARSDLYSLGCLMYEMLTGRPPFAMDDDQLIISAHKDETPDPLRTHNPAVSARTEAVVMRLLAKKPADRYATPTEVQLALAGKESREGDAPAGEETREQRRDETAPPADGTPFHCRKCGYLAPGEDRYCQKCGYPLHPGPEKCPNPKCKYYPEPGDRFCILCGAKLSEKSAAPAPALKTPRKATEIIEA